MTLKKIKSVMNIKHNIEFWQYFFERQVYPQYGEDAWRDRSPPGNLPWHFPLLLLCCNIYCSRTFGGSIRAVKLLQPCSDTFGNGVFLLIHFHHLDVSSRFWGLESVILILIDSCSKLQDIGIPAYKKTPVSREFLNVRFKCSLC